MTKDIRPKGTAELLQELSSRMYKVEQRASAPAVGGTGGGGTPDPHPSVDTITIDGIVVGSTASPARSLTLSTAGHMEDIWIDADWLPPLDGTAAHYDVEYARKVGASYELVGNIRTGGTSVRIHALEPQTTYGVRVIAINRIGVRATALPSSGFQDIATGIDATLPAQVTGVTLTCGFKTAMVKWNEVADRDVARGTGVYEVTLSVDASFAVSTQQIFTAGTVATFSDLMTAHTYYVVVRAIDNSGNAGPYSLVASDTTGQVGTVEIANGAVTTALLAAGAVDNSKLAALAVEAGNLANSSVTSTKIANLAVGTAAIQALAVGSAQIADAAIVTAKIGDLQVNTAKIADLAVNNAKIANLAVDDAKISSLDAGKITAGTIDANRIAANSIDVNKLTSSTLTSKTITIGAGGNLKIGNPPTTGIFINDQGIRLYSGSAVKVALDVAGTASFEGNISASTITSSTLTSATINSGTIQGVTITGATVRTASSGQRVAFESGIQDRIKLYTGVGTETEPGSLQVGAGVGMLEVSLRGPKATGGHAYPNVALQAYDTSTGDTQILNEIRNGDNTVKGKTQFLNQGSGETILMYMGGWFEKLWLDFGRTGTNAQMQLRGSGDYSNIWFYGGGVAVTLNAVLGLGSGLHVLDGANGSFHPIQASAFNIASSQATKKNIADAPDVLDTIGKMKVKKYQRIYDDKMKDPPNHISRAYEITELGLMAEEILAIVPDAVAMGADGPTGINLSYLVAMLVKAVQELNSRIPGPK